MNKYRFIRMGKNPTSQVDNEDTIRSCFAHCSTQDKQKLEAFFRSRQLSIMFHYSDHTVIIERFK